MIKGKRIFLRKVDVGDAAQLLAWSKNPRYQYLAGFSHYEDLNQAREGARIYHDRPASYLICLKDGTRIGLAELYLRTEDTREVGFMLDEAYEGRDYMTESLALLFDQAKECGIAEIWACCRDDNLPPQRLLTKMGFREQYEVDYRQIPPFFNFSAKYYLLKLTEWNKIETNTKS